MIKQELKPRMAAAASFARPGKRFADIGTDHAYLPVYLCENGIAPSGIASDINKGPLDRARQNISDAGLCDRIALNLADGMKGTTYIEPEDIYILGMGGELIARILSECDYVKKTTVRLILQPMTHQKDLRAWLLSSGFNIIDEKLVKEDGRIYQVICAEFDGVVREWSEIELLVGQHIIEKSEKLLCEYASNQAEIYSRAASGIEKSGKNAEYERSIEEKMRALAAKI